LDYGKSLRRISILKILDESFSLYLAKIEIFFPVFLLLNIPSMILVYIIGTFIPPFNPPNESANELFIWLINYGFSAAIFFSILFLAIWVITNLGSVLIIMHMSNVFEGGTNVNGGFSSITHLLGKVLALSLITGALMALGFILLFFPGILMAIIFSLATPIMVVERLNILGSLRRSKELTDNAWWKIFLLLLSIFIMFIMAILFAEFLNISFYTQKWIKEIFRVIIVSLIEPIYPISLTLLYYHLKKHKATPVSIEYPFAEAPSHVLGVKFCHYCGQVLPYDANYCPNCGRKIETNL
jgi:ribosomal protein L40E